MIRKATLRDVSRIAEIEVSSWRYAYQGIVSEEILYRDTLIENRIEVIKKWLNEEAFGVYVFEDDDKKIVKGIMGMGKCGDADKKDAYELHLLYIEPVYSRQGIGRSMLEVFENKGTELGCKELVIWVLADNRIGLSFYKKNKYDPDGSTKMFSRLNKKEIRYIKKI